jgi:hypothetical protein
MGDIIDGGITIPMTPQIHNLTGQERILGWDTEKAMQAHFTVEELLRPVDGTAGAALLKARTLDDITTPAAGYTNVMLLTGQPDEVLVPTNCTISPDLVNFKVGGRGHKLTIAGAVTASARLEVMSPVHPLVYDYGSCVGMWVHVPNAAIVPTISVDLYANEALNQVWQRGSGNLQFPLKNGWNLLRWQSAAGVLDGWGTAWRVRVNAVTTGPTEVTIGALWIERPPRATILFAADRPYASFIEKGYPDMKANGWPVTFSCDPALLGTGSGDALAATLEQLIELNNDGNQNSIGFHGWDGSPTANMTADELIADTIKAIKWLNRYGFTGGLWRSSFPQNLATERAAIQGLVLSYASGTSSSSITCWPPPSPWGLPRYAIHSHTASEQDDWFARLKLTRGLMLAYTHAISEDGQFNCTPEEWDYFIQASKAGVEEGWLEFKTFEQKFRQSGGVIEHGWAGIKRARYTDHTGTFVEKTLP